MPAEKTLLLLDSNALIHRAYHALPELTTPKGILVNAVYGFTLVFFRVLKEFQPDFVAAAFDVAAPTFRHKQFKEYKGKRPPAPVDLYPQFPYVKEVLRSFQVPIFEKEGFEGDDILGTIARQASRTQAFPGLTTIIVSGDLDTLQLVDVYTKAYTLRKGVKDTVLYDSERVQQKYGGLHPSQLPDFKALAGDPSDNIPGAPGIGEKTAIQLIRTFHNIENLYEHLERNSIEAGQLKPRVKEILTTSKEQVLLSKTLATIDANVPTDFSLEKCRWPMYQKEAVIDLFRNLGFRSLIEKIPEPQK